MEKDKQIREQSKQIHQMKEALTAAQKKATSVKVVNVANTGNPNYDLMTKRLSVLSNLLQQKQAIITKLMSIEKTKKEEIEKLNKQCLANGKLLSDEKEK